MCNLHFIFIKAFSSAKYVFLFCSAQLNLFSWSNRDTNKKILKSGPPHIKRIRSCNLVNYKDCNTKIKQSIIALNMIKNINIIIFAFFIVFSFSYFLIVFLNIVIKEVAFDWFIRIAKTKGMGFVMQINHHNRNSTRVSALFKYNWWDGMRKLCLLRFLLVLLHTTGRQS